MEATPFELTPEQKGMLASLSRETGKSIPALIAKALEELQEHEHSDQAHGERHAGQEPPPAARACEAHQPFWKDFSKPVAAFQMKNWIACHPILLPRWTIISTGPRNGSDATSVCRYLLLDSIAVSARPVARLCARSRAYASSSLHAWLARLFGVTRYAQPWNGPELIFSPIWSQRRCPGTRATLS